LNLFNERFFRFHSFGELENKNHLDNFVAIAEYYNSTTFAIWTKRKDLIKNIGVKPKNLIIIYSSPVINERVSIKSLPVQFDKVFSVYSKGKTGVKINCVKKCRDCMICYTKNRTKYINETIK